MWTNRKVYNCFAKFNGRMMKHLSFISSRAVVRSKRVFNGKQRRARHISRDFDNGPFLLRFIFIIYLLYFVKSFRPQNHYSSNMASTYSRRLLITRCSWELRRVPRPICSGNRARNLQSEILAQTKTKCTRSRMVSFCNCCGSKLF